jgi:hypothetical protein
MAKKILQKPKDWPVNPYWNHIPKGYFEKIVTPCIAQVIDDRDQQILREIRKMAEINNNSYWNNQIKYPAVPFDPFFSAIKKHDIKVKEYLAKKYEQG